MVRNTLREWGKWIYAGIAALAALIGGLLYWGGKRSAEKLGEEIGRLEADRERVREADKEGDDEGVLREWRRSRK